MLTVSSAFSGCVVKTSDGPIADFLFDDLTWKVRWLVVDAGSWLSGRKVLVHPSAIGKPDYEGEDAPGGFDQGTHRGEPVDPRA